MSSDVERAELRDPENHLGRDTLGSDLRIAHLSDIHFGRIAHPSIVDAIIGDVNAAGVDLVVASGDLTQRARTHEFEAARAMLDAFEAPVLAVPGNHDVRAWWHNPFERVWRSSKRFKRFITDDLTPTFTLASSNEGEAIELAVFGLNSSHGATIKGGKIRPGHVAEMEAYFAAQPTSAFRVLVLHHHLMRLEALGDHDVSRGAHLALDAAHRAQVDLVLCGHLHRSHVQPVELAPPSALDAEGHRIVVASAGTATSNRGRGDNANVNFYNWIGVGASAFRVEERRFDPDRLAFEPMATVHFERGGQAPARPPA
ncbi:MAG: metallophosphoesterase family protein [Rubricoccaceae bacterium]